MMMQDVSTRSSLPTAESCIPLDRDTYIQCIYICRQSIHAYALLKTCGGGAHCNGADVCTPTYKVMHLYTNRKCIVRLSQCHHITYVNRDGSVKAPS